MFTINQILTFAYESEYESAYDLPKKRLFSNPKIYTANGRLKKRWYVYFSYRDPSTGKLKRLTPFYGQANQYKTKEERLEVLTVYRKVLLKLLKQGYNPFEDNTALFEKLNPKLGQKTANNLSESISINQNVSEEEHDNSKGLTTITEAFEIGLKLKEKSISERTYKDYKNKINTFKKWLENNYPNITTTDQLNKKVFQDFLFDKLTTSSARNRDNYRTDLSSVMQVLEDAEIIKENYLRRIKKLGSRPERHKTYSEQQQKEIFEYLEINDPLLLLFIKFFSYSFMRPKEACRLRIKDINIDERTIQFKAKNSSLKTKLIPSILLKELPDITDMDQEAFLFTPHNIGGKWNASLESRRNYFSKRFRKVVKSHFKLGTDYGLYGFRHTYITKLYRAFENESSPFEAKSKLMQITGHSSMVSLEKYLRNIDAQLPKDFSDKLKTIL
ncbi:tyrosine-type recombinase/integrase [Winogradskyella sp. A2]|uniref:tyrosine-type recombinase/integrase n=1 Tax=Winogradskyella sp. A2 TaxID=3366944 RepID=UPI00398C67B5